MKQTHSLEEKQVNLRDNTKKKDLQLKNSWNGRKIEKFRTKTVEFKKKGKKKWKQM